MYWNDEGYLLSRKNFDENSLIVEAFTLDHGKCTGIVYGGSSRKQKKNFQIGNKLLIHYKSKGLNRAGYFNIELLEPVSPFFFDDKRRSICIVSASSLLKILLPERQTNRKIYKSVEDFFLNKIKFLNWINLYIYWELLLIKELGFEINFQNNKELKKNDNNKIEINNKTFNIPKFLIEKNNKSISKSDIKEALVFNKIVLMENFILPNRLKIPSSRLILEKYYN